MTETQLANLLQAQQNTIEQIALGAPLSSCLLSICKGIETMLAEEGAMSSVLLLDGTRLDNGVSCSLPEAYMQQINGVEIGPNVGCCGTAAFSNETVIVDDISSSPLWRDYAALASNFDLRSCWSRPICSSEKKVLGTFAIYFRERKYPEPIHLEFIDRFAHLSWLAIEKHRSVAREEELSKQLRLSNEKFSALAKVMPDLALIINSDLVLVDVYGRQLLSESGEEIFLAGHPLNDLFPEEVSELVTKSVIETYATKESELLEFYLQTIDGDRFFDGRTQILSDYLSSEDKYNLHVLLMVRDITERQQANQKIQDLAYSDALTKLPNRRLLLDRLSMLIHNVKRQQKKGAVLYLNLDQFKRINDSLGHSAGDQLLIDVADRLKPLVRKTDTLARMGGDEFVLVLDAIEQDTDKLLRATSVISEKILGVFKNPFHTNEGAYLIGCSIGVYIVEEGSDSVDDVLSRADAAMYTAKKNNGNSYRYFDPALEASMNRMLNLERDIITALSERQFFAEFQPICDFSKTIIGTEALIRWKHPKRGLVSPAEFIPVAEKYGFIHELQKTVLEQSCQLLIRLRDITPDLVVSINISAIEFATQSLKSNLMSVLDIYSVSPKQLKLEITESLLIDDLPNTIEQMLQLRELGFSFAIDDFGTGYSSLNYLHKLPIDQVKIDRSFVAKVEPSGGGTAVVEAIVALSKHFDFTVVAEGVETATQLELLSDRDVDCVQGFFLWRPMPQDALVDLLSKNHESAMAN